MKRTNAVLTVVLALIVPCGQIACSSKVGAIEPLVTHGGLGTFLHPIQAPKNGHSCLCGLDCCKDNVYIFGVNGLNPLCTGNFNGLLDYLRGQGFKNTYFGQLYTPNCYARKIRDIRQHDAHARVVLIGFSLGCNYVQCLANHLNHDDTRVDLVVYLGGDYIFNNERAFPCNVERVLNVQAHGICLTGGDLFFKGADIDGARNVRLPVRHILIPSRADTVELLMEELTSLACASAPVWVPGWRRAAVPRHGASNIPFSQADPQRPVAPQPGMWGRR
ncbi:MAG: alpha/beta hydrolase [Planctomycetes bacterium]|nr:alpha/beta hydrolase [Planctomycetota bacterium]